MEVRKIEIQNKVYPANLKNIFDPPDELYVKGDIIPEDSNVIAIVGTRTATYYGLEQAEKLSYELASREITIVSGMARGIDTAAHRGALKAGGRTIAVLGSGHNYIYPPENKKLCEEIIENGAVISEFPIDTPPLRSNFPRRNRIISGMSHGVVVVEAAARSGALITAHYALEQGREVFAIPGKISSVASSGTNKLIKDGAKLVENIWDITEELKNVIKIGQPDRATRTFDTQNNTGGLSDNEKIIYDILYDEPKHVDEILEESRMSGYIVSKALLKLELKKLIKVLPGEYFIKG